MLTKSILIVDYDVIELCLLTWNTQPNHPCYSWLIAAFNETVNSRRKAIHITEDLLDELRETLFSKVGNSSTIQRLEALMVVHPKMNLSHRDSIRRLASILSIEQDREIIFLDESPARLQSMKQEFSGINCMSSNEFHDRREQFKKINS